MAHYTSTKNFKGWDKILPNQEFNSNLYKSEKEGIEKSIWDCINDTCGIIQPQEELSIIQTDMFSIEEMASSPLVLRFMQWLIRCVQAKSVLEIGAFVGVSAMYFARALPEDGMVTTIEKFDHFAEIAKENFKNNGLDNKISLICADAGDVLVDLAQNTIFDFVFIDGNKERYADYLRAVEGSVRPGGLIIIDDALFHGDVLNDAFETEKGRGVREALDLAKGLQGWDKIFLPISNGLLLLRRQ